MDFRLKFESREKLYVYPIGELDINSTDIFKTEIINKYKEDPKNIVIVGDEFEYVDSTGLGAMIYLLKEIKDKNNTISLENLKPNIEKLFKITKLDEVFEIRSGSDD
ncbi:STAS domain-containing protein [Peptoniphilus sp. GNH]|nr:STAS domain protein [Clostridiales bacterium KA00134]UHR02336.1 STAS domain-containing protein [Peptoniphilus sp. GNH]